MSVRIQLDKPDQWVYTNLDFIAGKVFLSLPTDQGIAAINVKLEGESRTRLAGPKNPYNDRSDKKRVELEVHKLLYKVITVFPAARIRDQPETSSSYTLAAGNYQYPFNFKFPFNNNCPDNASTSRNLRLGSLGVQLAHNVSRHVKKTLPPSVKGFPGEAEIKYFVKATVVRPKFYQENLRTQLDIKFLPIEPPRKPNWHEETFARRKQQFQKPPLPSSKNLRFRCSSFPVPVVAQNPPLLQLDARLPNPPIVTCNEPLPLRLLVQNLNDAPGTARVSSLQIELVGHTHVRALDLTRTEQSLWPLFSSSNINVPCSKSSADQQRQEWRVPSRFWNDKPLPNTVAPSFETCNISRTYDLEIRVGLQHSVAGMDMPELMVLPLRIPVKVYSGVAPPPALLEAMALRPSDDPPHPVSIAAAITQTKLLGYASTPPTPASSDIDQSQSPDQKGSVKSPPLLADSDDAPPSYEDAMAEEIGPVDGPRRQYTLPGDPEHGAMGFSGDSKEMAFDGK